MPKSKAGLKTTLISTRVTPDVKAKLLKEALAEGLTISEWIRVLIISETGRRKTG